MSGIDLRDYILGNGGIWQDAAELDKDPFKFTLADTRRADRLMLRWEKDFLALQGPLRVRVTFQIENLIYNPKISPGPNPDSATFQTGTAYSYTLDIPAEHIWCYEHHPINPGSMGIKFSDRVLIEPAGLDTIAAPIAAGDMPCNLAVADFPDTASFFPAACETCEPEAQIRMPPLAPALSVRTADGGCVRTRFFNGMSITKEDLETEQRYLRIKNRFHNRTMGQGVVWGLNVAKQGDHVCVLPGYGLDCCGNDLTVTSVYKVEIASLLRDPAAAAAIAAATDERPQRMHLLLEYVECPTEPRPVHGDPCQPPQLLCEPSRTRETVRMRLVPPRDPDTSGPMHDFLLAAKTLHEKYGEEWTQKEVERPIGTRPPIGAEVGVALVAREADMNEFIAVAPGAPAMIPVRGPVTLFAQVSGGALIGGRMRIRKTDGTQIAEMSLTRTWHGRDTGLTIDLNPEESYLVELVDWRAELSSVTATGRAVTGTTIFRLTAKQAEGAKQWELLGETEMSARIIEGVTCSDPCGASIPWPWLHADPLCEPCAGDPKAALLGILGVWLQESGPSSKGWQSAAASELYRAAWLLFYGVDATDDKREVGEALQDMLRGWCSATLYPGPVCAGEPHGVVIGCAMVQGGTIGDIDPFGGRRWVVQYPLLTHWTSQLGLAPIDATASRLSSLLCCVAALPAPTTEGYAPAFVHKLAEEDIGADGSKSGLVVQSPSWTAYIAFGTENGVQQAYKNETNTDLEIGESKVLKFLTFARLVINVLRGQPTIGAIVIKPKKPEVRRYTLGGLVNPGVLSLLVRWDTQDRGILVTPGTKNGGGN